jgi:hypothetical protein
MDFTFGIITDGSNDIFLEKLIESILIQNIENYEIIIVGNTKLTNSNIIIIPFDESVHSSWITRKKNIIVRTAKYENIVLMHDYFILDSDWYNGFCKFGHDFDFCVNKIITKTVPESWLDLVGRNLFHRIPGCCVASGWN